MTSFITPESRTEHDVADESFLETFPLHFDEGLLDSLLFNSEFNESDTVDTGEEVNRDIVTASDHVLEVATAAGFDPSATVRINIKFHDARKNEPTVVQVLVCSNMKTKDARKKILNAASKAGMPQPPMDQGGWKSVQITDSIDEDIASTEDFITEDDTFILRVLQQSRQSVSLQTVTGTTGNIGGPFLPGYGAVPAVAFLVSMDTLLRKRFCVSVIIFLQSQGFRQTDMGVSQATVSSLISGHYESNVSKGTALALHTQLNDFFHGKLIVDASTTARSKKLPAAVWNGASNNFVVINMFTAIDQTNTSMEDYVVGTEFLTLVNLHRNQLCQLPVVNLKQLRQKVTHLKAEFKHDTGHFCKDRKRGSSSSGFCQKEEFLKKSRPNDSNHFAVSWEGHGGGTPRSFMPAIPAAAAI
jgi:hypothetical protein